MNAAAADGRCRLSNLAVGGEARLLEVGAAIEHRQREQLAAYGLNGGCRLRVMQQRPLTVIQADHLELALETAVAREIWVEAIAVG